MTAALKIAWAFISPWLAAIWGFVSKPPGIYVALVAALGLAWWISGGIGYSRGVSDCKATQRVIHDKQIVYIHDAKTTSEARTAPHAAQNQHNQQEAQNVADQAATRPDAGDECIPADLADRVRKLN